jgi:hypothetical protein
MKKKMKNKKFCKICSKKHMSKGFCKHHYEAYRRGNINIDGKVKDGYFFDSKYHIKKMKNTLGQTVQEDPRYRIWTRSILTRDKRVCVKCGKKGIKVIVHHHSKRFSEITKEAKIKFPNSYKDQVDFCISQHTLDIGQTLCKECHAEAHKGEKMYGSLSKRSTGDSCKVCGNDTYCMGFCNRHYKSYQIKAIDVNGKRLTPIRLYANNGKCIICGKESAGRGGKRFKFCKYHVSQYYRGVVNEDGVKIRKLKKIHKANVLCKICGGKYFSKGFCQMHYGRYKIGQIDIDGKELRKLEPNKMNGEKAPIKIIEFNGEKLSIQECAKKVGIGYRAMQKRLQKWGVEKALTTPITKSAIRHGKIFINFNGEKVSVEEYSKRVGVSRTTINNRLKNGALKAES